MACKIKKKVIETIDSNKRFLILNGITDHFLTAYQTLNEKILMLKRVKVVFVNNFRDTSFFVSIIETININCFNDLRVERGRG